MAVVIGTINDAHSLFRCLSLRLHGDPALFLVTRYEAVQHITSNWSPGWQKLTGFEAKEDYEAFMSQPSSSGTFAELRAVGEMYECTVAVVRGEQLAACHLQSGPCDPVVLRLHGRCFELYDSVPPGIYLRASSRLSCPPDLETARQQMEAGPRDWTLFEDCAEELNVPVGKHNLEDPDDTKQEHDPLLVIVPVPSASKNEYGSVSDPEMECADASSIRSEGDSEDSSSAAGLYHPLASAIDVEVFPIEVESPVESDAEEASTDACLNRDSLASATVEEVPMKLECPPESGSEEASADPCLNRDSLASDVEEVWIKKECPIEGDSKDSGTAAGLDRGSLTSVIEVKDFTVKDEVLNEMELEGEAGEVENVCHDEHGSKKPVEQLSKCSLCEESFETKCELTKHQGGRRLDGDFKCCQCSKVFKYERSLKSHWRISHIGQPHYEPSYKCDLCNRAFSSRSSVKVHRRRHTGERPFQCNTCPLAFPSKSGLNKHARVHTGERPYTCDVCRKAFSRACTLKIHRLRHTPDQHPFKCSWCGKTFPERGNLNVHVRKHTGEKPYKCELCPDAFAYRSALVAHMRTHTGQRPLLCESCPKTFTSRQELSRHGRVAHSNERPYRCELCPNAYAEATSLKVHMLTHLSGNHFKCDLCPQAFAMSVLLQTHQRRYHPGAQRVRHKRTPAKQVSTEVAV